MVKFEGVRHFDVPTSPMHLEALEPRTMLSGVTLITHGFQPLSSARPEWLDTMATAIAERVGSDAAIYAMRIDRTGSGDADRVSKFDLLSGSPPSISSTGETVVLLDWADSSGIFLDYTSTATIAQLALPFLTNAIPTRGIDRPLAESPIHLIGHSRGTSVVTHLAGLLGVQGIWVDQVTTLDPHPVSPDPAAVLFQNVVFADNYFQQDDLTTFGLPVAGSFETNLTPIVPDHSLIHTYYHGTVDTDATNDGDAAIQPSWYTHVNPLTGPRNAIGYHYSRIGRGNRFAGAAVNGLHPLFGLSNASRVPLDLSNATWPSLIALGVNDADRTYVAGEPIHPVPFYADVDSGGQIAYFLDKDTNPYNTDEVVLGLHDYDPTGEQVLFTHPSFSTAGASPGTYHVYAQIADSNGLTRFMYTSGTVEIVAPPLAATTAPLVTIKATDKSAGETGGGTAAGRGTFTVTRVGLINDPLTVHYSFTGTAENDGHDYAMLSGFVTIPAGAKSAVIHVDPVDDAIAEVPETLVVTLAESSDYRLGKSAEQTATVTIADNESIVSVTASGKTTAEATPVTKPGKVRFSRTGGSIAVPLSVSYLVGGTAQNGVDYTSLNGTTTIPAGQKYVDVFITPVDDLSVEALETVTITLEANPSYRIDAKKTTGTVTIADNEPVVSIKATDKAATEKDAGVSVLAARGLFTITRKGKALATPLVVTYSVTGNASPNVDYAALTGTATIPAGLSSVTIQVNPIDDLIAEPAETVIVTLEAGDSYRLGKDKEQTATVTIADFELAPQDVSGLLFDMKVTQGTPPFAAKGSVGTWGISEDGDEYVLIGAKGMQTSRGDFTYQKLTSTTARFTTSDILGFETEGTLVFSKANLATFTATEALGGMQTGTFTMLKPATFQAPNSIVGKLANAKITSGQSPFASKGTFLMSFNSGGLYSILGGSGVASSNGSFTYERFNVSFGLLEFTDNFAGEGWGVLRFTSTSKLNYALVSDTNGATQTGTMTLS